MNEEIDPYDPPSADPEMADITEYRFYNLVWKMVLWDEDKERIYKRLEINKVPKDIADLLYEHAREDRIRSIRSDCLGKIWAGVFFIIATCVTYYFCWFKLGFFPMILLFGFALGFWLLVDGFNSYVTAPRKRGSLADSDD